MSIKVKKLMLFIIMILIIISTTGCWDNRDLTKRAFIAGIGLDKTEDDKVQLTLQLVKPLRVNKSESDSSKGDPIWVHTTTGDTLHEAVRNQFVTVNRKPFYSHVQVIVIGEELARSGIIDVLDFFERDHEATLRTSVLISKDIEAKEILEARSDLENIPAIHIREIIEASKVNLAILNVNLLDIIGQISSNGKSPAIGVIQIVKENEDIKIKDLTIEGGSVFKKDKFIGWLNPLETEGFKYTQDKMGSGIINVSNPFENSKQIAIEQTRVKGKMDVQLEGEKLEFYVEVKAEGIIGNQEGIGKIINGGGLEELQKQCEKEIKQRIEDVIKHTQKEYNTDIFGFGEIVHRKYLAYWNNISENWDAIFCKTPVVVNVKFNINNTGIIDNSVEGK